MMSDHSKIEWTDATWNPTTGCTRVSEGCRHCYIERTPPFRIAGRKFVNGSTGVQLHPERLDQPLHWKKPRRIFVNSLSDLFHEDVPYQFIDKVFGVMGSEEAGHHTFQVLTKRPERMLRYTERFTTGGVEFDKLFPLVWLGVSVEDQRTADERIPLLLQTPAAIRFVSAEPLLGPVDLGKWMWIPDPHGASADLMPSRGLDQCIVGGESGPGARPCDVSWIRSIVAQCRAAGTKVFVKQLGAFVMDRNDAGFEGDTDTSWPMDTYLEDVDGEMMYQGARVRVRLRDRKGGNPEEWPADLQVRELPA